MPCAYIKLPAHFPLVNNNGLKIMSPIVSILPPHRKDAGSFITPHPNGSDSPELSYRVSLAPARRSRADQRSYSKQRDPETKSSRKR